MEVLQGEDFSGQLLDDCRVLFELYLLAHQARHIVLEKIGFGLERLPSLVEAVANRVVFVHGDAAFEVRAGQNPGGFLEFLEVRLLEPPSDASLELPLPLSALAQLPLLLAPDAHEVLPKLVHLGLEGIREPLGAGLVEPGLVADKADGLGRVLLVGQAGRDQPHLAGQGLQTVVLQLVAQLVDELALVEVR